MNVVVTTGVKVLVMGKSKGSLVVEKGLWSSDEGKVDPMLSSVTIRKLREVVVL